MLYAVLPRCDWDNATELSEHGGVVFIAAGRIHDRVDELSGRTNVLRIPSIARKLRSGSRVYIQGRPGGTLGSLLVQRVPNRK